MKLHQYPQVIAEIEFKILNASCQLEIQTEQIGFMDGEIEVEIASNSSLTNQQLNKTTKAEKDTDQSIFLSAYLHQF